MAGRVDKARELTNGTRTNALLPVEAFGVDGFADGEAVWFWHPLLVLNPWRSSQPDRASINL